MSNEIEIWRTPSYRDGYAAGLREGYRRGQEDMRERAAECTWPGGDREAIRALPIEELPEEKRKK